MTGIVTDFNNAAADLRRVLPDLSVTSLAACGVEAAQIPLLNLRLWNEMKRENNCYNFATNHAGNDLCKPGGYSWDNRAAFMKAFHRATFDKNAFEEFSALVREGMRRDRHQECGTTLNPEFLKGKKGWLVALFLADSASLAERSQSSEEVHDFHFYALRRVENKPECCSSYFSGKELPQIVWAHKTGSRAADVCFSREKNTALISRSSVVFDDAKSRGYNHFGGFYLVSQPPPPIY